MIALYIILGLALLICAVLFFPFVLVLEYKDELKTYQKILFLKIPLTEKTVSKIGSVSKGGLFGKKEKPSNTEETKKAAKGKDKLREVLDVLSIVRAILKKFLKYLRVKITRLNIKVASPDPAATAIAYGAVNTAIGSLYPFLEGTKNVKGIEKVHVLCDFIASIPDVDIKISFRLRVWQVLSILISVGVEKAKDMAKNEKN